ncbi:hypothetical protein J7T55_003829 [Diaporthe amygdali]|uniref:uncharacterized protein n=1 Tax=Phomopsis amygdali TaxID=1214568 RepID=UPI0022FF354C|nr:uncharacterized protein J7T55_003829 [Diaporthe amygdali]KAJ0117415.1 hypothetical protein J7T55_003829 [Diaporthe amygdali]
MQAFGVLERDVLTAGPCVTKKQNPHKFHHVSSATQIMFLSLLRVCWAQIPDSDVGNYPSGVLTLIGASWLFFRNSTSTLYGMVPQYWLLPGLQTARKQHRDDLKNVRCCEKNCYNGVSADIIDQAERLRRKFTDRGVNLEDASKQIVASGSWSFSTLAEAKGQDKRWISDFDCWERDVNAGAQSFWTYGTVATVAELLRKSVVVKTVDAITVRVGSRRRTMDITSVAGLLTHSVAAAAARDAQACVVFEAMLISIWAGVASINHQRPTMANNVTPPQCANPVLVPASTLKLRSVTPPQGANIAYEPIQTHGLWVYIVLITAARVTISGATGLGSSGSLWLAVFTGLYLTNPSAAGSFGREKYDARADSGLMSGGGFYMNFNRDTMTMHVKLHDRLESVSVVLSLMVVVIIRLFKLRLRSLLGYGTWVPSAPWQMVPGILLSTWASFVYSSELTGNLDKKRPESKDIIEHDGFIRSIPPGEKSEMGSVWGCRVPQLACWSIPIWNWPRLLFIVDQPTATSSEWESAGWAKLILVHDNARWKSGDTASQEGTRLALIN